MSEGHPNARLLREFPDAQNRFYGGGDQAQVRAMLAEDVAWHVPGHRAIAGEYRGRDEVLRYFVGRRELAHATFRIVVRALSALAFRARVRPLSSWPDIAAYPELAASPSVVARGRSRRSSSDARIP